MRATVATVHLDRLRKNVQAVQSLLSPGVGLMAVVKANAYGHGALRVAQSVLEAGAMALAVALVEEGVALRQAGIDAPILVLGQPTVSEVDEAVANDLDIVVFEPLIFKHLTDPQAAGVQRRARVHLKIDTGMGRIGIFPGNLDPLWLERLRSPRIALEGVMTHFANADSCGIESTTQQMAEFLDVLELLRVHGLSPRYVHAANSAAALRFPGAQFNMVRVGIALYGLEAFAPMPPSFSPVMSLESRVTYVKAVPQGFKVGYGSTYTTPGAMKIATVPIGYADGYRRAWSNNSRVIIREKEYAVVGRISMDQLTVGVPLNDAVEIGDRVVLIGESGGHTVGADDLARAAGTIGYEVVTGIANRVPRIYVD